MKNNITSYRDFHIKKERLENLYEKYNRPEFIDPDPLAFLYHYQDTRDREIVGLLASCLAYGRVELIMNTVEQVLRGLGDHPFQWIRGAGKDDIRALTRGFVYRFARDTHLAALLLGIRQVLRDFGSLEACFYNGMKTSVHGDTIIGGLAHLRTCLDSGKQAGHLLADPLKKSACKRSCLFLRWMIRKDRVDPGGWDASLAKDLIVPLDTHMFAIGKLLGFTHRNTQDMKTAIEITRGFGKMVPEDPVKYDFCLTRFGIRRELGMNILEKEFSRQPRDVHGKGIRKSHGKTC